MGDDSLHRRPGKRFQNQKCIIVSEIENKALELITLLFVQ